MSQQNVNLVVGLPFYAADMDLVRVRDAEIREAWIETVTPLFHEEIESVFPGLLGGGETQTRVEGFARLWLEWLAAWESYRISLSEAIDGGDQVVVCYEVLATPTESTGEIRFAGADVWTVRDGKIARWAGYPSRAKALKAAGIDA